MTSPASADVLDSYAPVVAEWYSANARDLPWRRAGTTPWGVLVSEVMLQQTPVSRVTQAWHEWLARWPTPAALAADQPGEAIRAWGRLGYPRRALRLHECAVAITERHDGEVPTSLEDLLALPGVGTYTARAVAAFAYGQRHPVVDTNVRRVAARAVLGAADAGPATTAADLTLVESLLPAEPPLAALVSAALMELGAVVCVARSPRCAVCPLAEQCRWLISGAPAPTGPTRRPQAYAGTDRQVRGKLLAVLRESHGPVPKAALDAVWGEGAQRERALGGLLEDGLVVSPAPGVYALPGA